MKINHLLFSIMIVLAFLSCEKDDGIVDCNKLSENIIGIWQSEQLGEGFLEFEKRGKLNDPDDLLTSYFINEDHYKKKEWSAVQNDQLEIFGIKDDLKLSTVTHVIKLSCDTITLRSGPFTAELVRQ